ncbi:MAG TPA: M28 family peptidase, partial [Bacteroidales bacterium]|nr:M28 family peptidase [Bacteroidales bacterium]
MKKEHNLSTLTARAEEHLITLCERIGERNTGSEGNRKATSYFRDTLISLGWEVRADGFEAMDWQSEGAELTLGSTTFAVSPSPYSLGCKIHALLAAAGSITELEAGGYQGKILLLHGELAQEQLMPKNFVFYNPEHHQRIIALLEKECPAALVCATGWNPALAGGVYPFPLIEDGDFGIPSVFMTEAEGERLLPMAGGMAHLHSRAERIWGDAYNISGIRRGTLVEQIMVTAHIDAKNGTPGAIDNGTGVTALLLLAELLKTLPAGRSIELLAFNGEDHYAVPGQMHFLRSREKELKRITLNINIDGAGYHQGGSAMSLFGLLPEQEKAARDVIAHSQGFS